MRPPQYELHLPRNRSTNLGKETYEARWAKKKMLTVGTAGSVARSEANRYGQIVRDQGHDLHRESHELKRLSVSHGACGHDNAGCTDQKTVFRPPTRSTIESSQSALRRYHATFSSHGRSHMHR
jgi:hypothetical protein